MKWNKVNRKRAPRVRRMRIFGSNIVYRDDSMIAVLVAAGMKHWDHRWIYLRRLQTAICLVLLASFLSQSERGFSNPEGGQVVEGGATISSPSSTTLQVDQQTQIVIIDWSTFNIATGETTQFNQPGTSALAVNRIGDNNPSQILGNLLANGRIVLINGNGIIFGPNARIDTGSFIATTSDASNEEIMSGKATFDKAGNPNAMIVNEGSINAKTGLVGLIAPAVRNDGIITAKLGSVTLGASNVFTLDFTGDGLISFPLDANVVARAIDANGKPVEALVVNNGKIEGATVLLTARAARDLVTNVISMGGTIVATSVHQDGGNVVLDGGDGGVIVNGTITAVGRIGGNITVTGGDITLSGATLDASGTEGGGTIKVGDWSSSSVHVDSKTKLSASALDNGNGGNIAVIAANTQFAGQADAKGGLYGGNGGLVETSGHSLDIAGALIDTSAVAGNAGTWLLDPDDYTINAAQAATIVTNLATGNVTIMTTFAGSGGNGNIFVNAPIVWSSAFSLTLSAYRNINVNANITNSAGANIILRADNSATGIGTVIFGGGTISTSGTVSIFYNPSGNNNSTVNAFSYTSPTNYSGNVSGGATLYAYMLVNTVYDLQNMQNNLSGTYALGGDIDASVTSSWNSGAGFAPIGTATGFPAPSGTPFTGVFYGQNYAISNLTINRPGTDYVGLFGYVGAGALIRDVGLIDANVTGGQEFVGGLVGYNQFGTIVGSYVTGTVTGAASGGVDVGYVGGLVGLNKGTITQSYADAVVSGHNYVGGLVGSNHGTVLYSYALGNVRGNDSIGGLAGYNWISTGFGIITQTYSTGLVTGVTNVGALVGFNDNGTVSQSYWDSTINAIGGLGGSSGGSFSASGLATSAFYSLSSFVGWSFGTTPNEEGCTAGTAACWVIVDANGTLNNAGGSAGATRPFLLSEYSTTISNSHQLQLMALNLAGNYTLGRNIDLGPALASASGMWGSAGFVPIGYAFGDPNPFSVTPFTGTFDGQGHSISNLVINRSTTTAAGDYTGLFGYSTGTIKNVTLINPHVSGHFAVGSLAGFSSGAIQNVTATGGLVSSDRYYIGGLIGWNKGSVTNAWYSGTVVGGDVVGGLVGFNDSGTVTSSHASAAITGVNYLGGLVGYNGGAISGSYATGAVTGSATSDYVGGLVGWNNAGTITNSYATGTVTGRNYVGGLLGYGISGSVLNSYATGNVNGVTWVGGLIGWTDGSVSGSHASGNVSGTQYVGGLVGELGHAYVSGGVGSGSVTNSYATGTVSASQNYAGGLIGQSWGSVTNSYATGNVSGGDRVGGLIGVNEIFSYTANSYATGNVTGTGANENRWIGGLAGVNAGTITLSYATGNVFAPTSYYVGGLVGYNWCCRLGSYTEINQSYATGNVTGFQSVGGLVGQNESTGSNTSTVVTQSYATGTVTGPQDVGGLVGQNNNATITQSYATGAVSASTYNPGGLVGYNAPGGTISYSYATGAVSLIGGAQWAGGFVGWNNGSITQSYSTGLVSGPAGQFVGGFAGNSGSGTITLSYWDTQTSGHSNGLGTGPAMAGLIAQTTAQLKNGALPNGFDAAFWGLFSSNSYPCLLWQASCLRVITYSVGDSSSTYGTLATLGTVTLTGVLVSDLANVVGVVTIYDSSSSAVTLSNALNAGLYTVKVTGLTGSAASNYIISSTGNTNGILTINPAPLIVAVNDASRLYGDANPAFSATITGFVLGQDASVLSGLVFSTVATQSSNVGDYAITSSGGTAANYIIVTRINGTLTINPAPLIVAVNDASRLYGDANPIFSATITGFVLGQDASVLSGLVFSTVATQSSNVGDYAITSSGGTAANYIIVTRINGTLTINPAPLIVAVNDASRLYGDANPEFSATITGFVLGQDASVLSGLVFSTVATQSSDVGNYAITSSGGTAQNYYIASRINGTLTINPAPLIVAVNDASRLYGDANPEFSATITGFVLGQDASVLSGLVFSTVATQSSDVGTYVITSSGGTAQNYYIASSTSGTLTINPAPLIVAVNDASRLFDEANPEFSATITGFVLGQDASVLSGLTLTTSAGQTSLPGTYAIVALGGTAKNYVIVSRLNGTLTIEPRIREGAPQVMATLRCAAAAGHDQEAGNASCDFDPRFDGWFKHVDIRQLPVSNNDDIACAVAGVLIDCHRRVMVQ